MTGPEVPDRSWIAVCEAPFLPARDGGQREHHGLIRALAERGVLAALVICTREELDRPAYRELVGAVPVVAVPRRESVGAHLRPTTPFVWASRRSPAAERRAVALGSGTVTGGHGPGGVLACSFKSAELADRMARRLSLPLVVRQHNVESTYHRDLGRSGSRARRTYFALESSRIRLAEARLVRSPRLAGFAEISTVDRRARRAEHGPSCPPTALVPPLAVRWGALEPGVARTGVCYLGALDVATNQHGLRWFLDAVWPLVLRRRAEARLTVAGRRPDPAFAAFLDAQPRVTTHYDVADPSALLSASLVAVNPTVSGSGINIKLLEYAAAGAAVVTTPRASAGLPEFDRRVLRESAAADGFADHVAALLADPCAAADLGAHLHRELGSVLDDDRAVRALDGLLPVEPCVHDPLLKENR